MFILNMDGRQIGELKGGEFPHLKRAEVDEAIGPTVGRVKHYSSVTIDPARLVFGMMASNELLGWLRETVAKKVMRRNLMLTSIDMLRKTAYESEMFNCLIREISLPAVDVKSKDDATITVTVQPEYIKDRKLPAVKTAPLVKPSNPWKASDFTFEIDGLDGMSKAVKSVSALTIKQGIKAHFAGSSSAPSYEPTKLEGAHISFALPKDASDGLYKWNEQQMGQATRASPGRTGRLEYLSPKRQTYFAIEFMGLGIVALKPAQDTVTCELFYESVSIAGL